MSDTEWNMGERIAIRDSAKSLKKYGSTCNHLKRPETYITHVVEKTDTLQGLALRYNTTTDQIRRINRLFASDSLFLRVSLKIPVPLDMATTFDGASESSSHSSSGTTSGNNTSSISTESFSDDEEKSVNDFLCKIDSSIASTRAHAKHVQENSHFVDAKDPTMVKRRSNRSQNSCADTSDTPQAVVLNQGRKVRNSLQRLEEEQDVLFEL